MTFEYVVTPVATGPPPPPPSTAAATLETAQLLRQILEVQREQLHWQRATAAAHDASSRWRAFAARWQQDFPDLTGDCRLVLPILERSYGALIAELAEHLRGQDAVDNEFALAELLDRYGMRLTQLGTLLNLVGLLAEVPPGEPSAGT